MTLTQLGRYKIETHLGSGAFADVYKATDQTLKRTVALKVLKPALVADGEAFNRFVQEAQLAANLFHPHIATVLDMGEAEGHYYIAMRFVDGLSLDKALAQRGSFSWEEALKITSQIGEALDFAHQKGLVHRDVKPQNVILSQAEGGVLTDFGLVRAMTSSGMTTTGAMLGTPAYIAPEIWEGEDATPATDQYALASVLVEILTGKVLFEGKTPPAVMAKHFKSPEIPPIWPQGAPVGLSEVLKRALALVPKERFETNRAFLESLRQPEIVNPQVSVKIRQPEIVVQKSPIPFGHAVVNPAENLAEIEWVEIPAGEFLYGDKNEKLILEEPFLIGKYPVTNAQYKLFLDATPRYPDPKNWDARKRTYHPGKENHPVVNISWHDAQAFCRWARCRLLTEIEWEKAARGEDGRLYPWGTSWGVQKCNSAETNLHSTTPVDRFPAGVSPYGVWDLSGNTWEWTATRAKQGGYVMRGGSWDDYSFMVRAIDHGWFLIDSVSGNLGFRCARSL